ncbi:MAG: hypothetical protein P9X24_01030 [Candidatus Hatepunaea meridiana]|nr:hypothetical protein [Candidatus Hatepunaea meridiana]
MRLILSIVIICCMVTVSSGTESDQENKGNNKPDAGAKAFLFETGTDLQIGSYKGILLAGRYHFSTTRALELRVRFDGEIGDSEFKDEEFRDSLEVRESIGDDYSYLIGLSCVYLMYNDQSSNLMPFWGIGPTFEYRYDHLEDKEGVDYIRNTESSDMGVGLTTDIGFEWFILPKISLTAVYRMKLLYSWDKDTREYWRDDRHDILTTERKSLDFGHERTEMGIALYF